MHFLKRKKIYFVAGMWIKWDSIYTRALHAVGTQSMLVTFPPFIYLSQRPIDNISWIWIANRNNTFSSLDKETLIICTKIYDST